MRAHLFGIIEQSVTRVVADMRRVFVAEGISRYLQAAGAKRRSARRTKRV